YLNHCNSPIPYSIPNRVRPRFSLLPYTTLFRSHAAEAQVFEDLFPAGARPERVGAGLDLVVHAEDPCVEPEEERGADQVPGGERDRKSTRLNSSHVKISYAVFCLKKKKDSTKNQ